MTLDATERKMRGSIRAAMRDIARQIWRLPAPRQAEIKERLLVILHNLETEANRPKHSISL